MSAFLAKRRDKDGLEYGIFAEFCKNFPPCGKTGNIILDWRWMYDNDFFYDFFYDVYQVKSKTYNSLYFSRNFSGGILSAALRDDAGEKFLDIEKIPELQFYTPFFQVNGSPVFLENNFSLTNFYKGGDYYLRSMDMLTLKTEKDMGGFLFSPYLSFAGSGYRYPEENRFNVMGEAGTGVSVLLKKEKSFATEYFRPAVSIFYRGLRLERGELEYFDRMEDMNGGKFARTSMDWSFWGREGYLGRIAVENLFDMDRGGFEENLLKYDIRVTRNLHVSGDNKWDMGRKRYLFGVNDLVLDYEKHGYSFGTRYDRDGNISGVAGELRHEVNDAWRYVFKTHYDVEEGSFARQSLECWMKMHCWELNFRITREDEGFSFYVFAYPILL